MQNSRNIIKRLALSRCPSPALSNNTNCRESLEIDQIFGNVRFAYSCRELYTKLPRPGYYGRLKSDELINSSQNKCDMTRLKLVCGLKPRQQSPMDYLERPLKFSQCPRCQCPCCKCPYCQQITSSNQCQEPPIESQQVAGHNLQVPSFDVYLKNKQNLYKLHEAKPKNVRLQNLRISAVPKQMT